MVAGWVLTRIQTEAPMINVYWPSKTSHTTQSRFSYGNLFSDVAQVISTILTESLPLFRIAVGRIYQILCDNFPRSGTLTS